MRYGKITQTAWQRSVRKQLHTKRDDTAGQPTPWGNCSGIAVDGTEFCWTDSCVTGRTARTGYYAVLEAAGDLAAQGVRITAVSVRILFPYGSLEEELKAVAAGIEEACACLNVQVVNIQGEVSPAAAQTIVFVSASGYFVKHSIQALSEGHKKSAVKEREILLCGYVGLSGMLRILDEAQQELESRFVTSFLAGAKELKNCLVRPDQLLKIFENSGADNRCDPVIRQIGSGGVLAALWETAEMLGVGFEISQSSILLKQETVEICEFYHLNPYQMTSSGSFLIVTEDAENVIEVLEKAGARAGKLGVIKAQNARVITSGEEIRFLDRPATDALICWESERMNRLKS